MIISAKIIPNAKKNTIKKDGDILKIYVTTPPEDGRANKALIDFLAKEYKVSKSKIRIVKGEKSRNKIIEIL